MGKKALTEELKNSRAYIVTIESADTLVRYMKKFAKESDVDDRQYRFKGVLGEVSYQEMNEYRVKEDIEPIEMIDYLSKRVVDNMILLKDEMLKQGYKKRKGSTALDHYSFLWLFMGQDNIRGYNEVSVRFEVLEIDIYDSSKLDKENILNELTTVFTVRSKVAGDLCVIADFEYEVIDPLERRFAGTEWRIIEKVEIPLRDVRAYIIKKLGGTENEN